MHLHSGPCVSIRKKFKIVSHWRPEWCSRGAFTVGLVVALKHLCNKSEVSRCWGHGTQDTRKLRSLKKCRTALQAELSVTIQLLFWKEETPCTAAGFCVRCEKKERAAWCLCLRCQWQLSPFVLGVKKWKEQLVHCINTLLHSSNKVYSLLE